MKVGGLMTMMLKWWCRRCSLCSVLKVLFTRVEMWLDRLPRVVPDLTRVIVRVEVLR